MIDAINVTGGAIDETPYCYGPLVMEDRGKVLTAAGEFPYLKVFKCPDCGWEYAVQYDNMPPKGWQWGLDKITARGHLGPSAIAYRQRMSEQGYVWCDGCGTMTPQTATVRRPPALTICLHCLNPT